MTFFGWKLNQDSNMSDEKKKKEKAEMATFFSCRTQFHLVGGLVIYRI